MSSTVGDEMSGSSSHIKQKAAVKKFNTIRLMSTGEPPAPVARSGALLSSGSTVLCHPLRRLHRVRERKESQCDWGGDCGVFPAAVLPYK